MSPQKPLSGANMDGLKNFVLKLDLLPENHCNSRTDKEEYLAEKPQMEHSIFVFFPFPCNVYMQLPKFFVFYYNLNITITDISWLLFSWEKLQNARPICGKFSKRICHTMWIFVLRIKKTEVFLEKKAGFTILHTPDT